MTASRRPASPTPGGATHTRRGPRPSSRPVTVRRLAAAASLAATALAPGRLRAQARIDPPPRYAAATAALERFVSDQMAEKGLPALSIALVDDQRVVWARGFGAADSSHATPARADTPYRVGQVSALLTTLGVMQLVDQGTLALDTPVTAYLPDFAPRNTSGLPVTLRQLLSRRSGLVREPPVGSPFDPTAPTLAATVGSLNETSLVYEPGARLKYSDAAVATAGYVLERTAAAPFADYMAATVLGPLGMARSSFAPDSTTVAARARGTTWTLDGRTFPAPTFPLGVVPATELTAPMLELGRALSALFDGGRAIHVEPRTLETMWGGPTGAALGFAVSELDGRLRIGICGRHFGTATEVAALPREKLGVAVATAVDGATAVTGRIADAALRLLLAVREGRPLPAIVTTAPVPVATMRRLAGSYRGAIRRVELALRDGGLWYQDLRGGTPAPLRSRGDTLVADGRLAFGQRILWGPDLLVVDGDTLRRVPDVRPLPAPDEWRGLVGEYGRDDDVLYVLERDGQLYALIEWFALYPLAAVDAGVFRFPDQGRYAGETLTFARDATGRAGAAAVSAVVFRRRALGPEDGSVFRITPTAPVAELRRRALAATPPPQRAGLRASDLVDLTTVDPRIRLDIRYATRDNFMGAPMYSSARAYLQRPAAEALVRVQRALAARGYGLLVHDGYRPWYVTKMFWDAMPPPRDGFVADPRQGSRHNRGCSVDLSLYDLATGRPVPFVSGYDEFTPRARRDYPGGTALERWDRDLLRRAMEAEGFLSLDNEWWHFDWHDWARYPVLNLTFEQLAARAR